MAAEGMIVALSLHIRAARKGQGLLLLALPKLLDRIVLSLFGIGVPK
jgi:hypothetical protein